MRLPTAIITRWPARMPWAPRPVARRATSSSSAGPGERAPAALDEGLPVGHVVGGLGHQLGDVGARHAGILPQPGAGRRPPLRWPGDPVRAAPAPQPAAALGPRGRGRGGVGGGRERPRLAQRPDRGRLLRRRQHRHAGRQHLPPRARAVPPQVLHHPGDRLAPRGSRPTSGSSASRTPSTWPTRATPRCPSSPGTPSPSSRSSARRSSTRRWPTGSGPAPAPWPSSTSTRASGSGW